MFVGPGNNLNFMPHGPNRGRQHGTAKLIHYSEGPSFLAGRFRRTPYLVYFLSLESSMTMFLNFNVFFGDLRVNNPFNLCNVQYIRHFELGNRHQSVGSDMVATSEASIPFK